MKANDPIWILEGVTQNQLPVVVSDFMVHSGSGSTYHLTKTVTRFMNADCTASSLSWKKGQ